jgi:hypothetical protein
VAEPTPRHADDHRDGAAPAVADFRRIVHELIEAGGHEVVELHLADRPLPRQRRPNAHAEDAAFRERRIDDAVAELREQRAQQQEGVPVLAADIFAVDEHARIAAERVADAEHHRLEKGPPTAIERRSGLERRKVRRRREGGRRRERIAPHPR